MPVGLSEPRQVLVSDDAPAAGNLFAFSHLLFVEELASLEHEHKMCRHRMSSTSGSLCGNHRIHLSQLRRYANVAADAVSDRGVFGDHVAGAGEPVEVPGEECPLPRHNPLLAMLRTLLVSPFRPALR